MIISTKKLAFIFLLVGFVQLVKAQVKIGENPTAINKGSILELESANKGLLFPRIALTNTTTWSLATGSLPVAGMVVYNTKKVADGFAGTVAYPISSADGTGLYYWDGSGWVATKGNAASIFTGPWNLEATSTAATQNTQNIYQMGKVGIGNSLATNQLHVTATVDPVRLEGLQTGTTSDEIVVATNTGVLKTIPASTFESVHDLRMVGLRNHITQDAGFNGNGGNVGTGAGNIGIGNAALFSNTTGGDNIAIGSNTLNANTTGGGNTAIGGYSMEFRKTGNWNSAYGWGSLRDNDGGTFNTAIGVYSLWLNKSGSRNTAVGVAAMRNGLYGTDNTAMGYNSLFGNQTGLYNVAIGNLALNQNSASSYNTAVGGQALLNAGTYSDDAENTAIGYTAGLELGKSSQQGNKNTFLGSKADFVTPLLPISNTINGATAIGYNARVSQSNSLVLGGTGVDAVRVGINTTAPTNKLHLVGDGTNDPVRLEGLKASNNAADKIVVADANGVLKTIPAFNNMVNNIIKISNTYTTLATDYTILANATATGFTLNLPTAASSTGRILIIRKTDETANILTFSMPIKISETTSFTQLNVNTTIRIQSDGTDWYKID